MLKYIKMPQMSLKNMYILYFYLAVRTTNYTNNKIDNNKCS